MFLSVLGDDRHILRKNIALVGTSCSHSTRLKVATLAGSLQCDILSRRILHCLPSFPLAIVAIQTWTLVDRDREIFLDHFALGPDRLGGAAGDCRVVLARRLQSR